MSRIHVACVRLHDSRGQAVGYAVALVVLLGIAGCGDSFVAAEPAGGASISQSHVVNETPPETASLIHLGSAIYAATSHSPDVMMNLGGTQTPLAISGEGVLFAELWSVGGEQQLVVGTVDSSGLYTLSRWPDTNADGLPDAGGRVPLLTTTSPSYLTSIQPYGSRWLGFDRRCHDILRLTDQSADGWPDQVEATPFATSQTYQELLQTIDFMVLDANTIRLGRPEDPLDVYGGPQVRLRDTDGDHVADDLVTFGEFVVLLELESTPCQGLGVVSVRAAAGAAGRQAELVAIDSGGAETLLGTATLVVDSNSSFARADITLSRNLVEGEHIRAGLMDVDDDLHVHAVVLANEPIFESITPARPTPGVAQAVTVFGQNLNQPFDLVVRGPDGSLTAVTFVVVSESEITFTLPALGTAGCTTTASVFGVEDGSGPSGDPIGRSMRFTLE